jgi:hypothetical protein
MEDSENAVRENIEKEAKIVYKVYLHDRMVFITTSSYHYIIISYIHTCKVVIKLGRRGNGGVRRVILGQKLPALLPAPPPLVSSSDPSAPTSALSCAVGISVSWP